LSGLQIEYAIRDILENPGRGSSLVQKAMAWKVNLPGGFETPQSSSPIIPVILGSNDKAVHFSSRLKARGFEAKALRYPTVPKGSERLRLTIKSFHTQKELSKLAQALQDIQS
jgi:8-amino-7-oxononanoate synthase